jgi:hypothetical protein
VFRVSHNPTGRTIRGPALRGLAAPSQTTGPIVVTFETPSPTSSCQTFPTEAQAAVQAAADVWNVQIQSLVQIDVRMCWLSMDPGVLGIAVRQRP